MWGLNLPRHLASRSLGDLGAKVRGFHSVTLGGGIPGTQNRHHQQGGGRVGGKVSPPPRVPSEFLFGLPERGAILRGRGVLFARGGSCGRSLRGKRPAPPPPLGSGGGTKTNPPRSTDGARGNPRSEPGGGAGPPGSCKADHFKNIF